MRKLTRELVDLAIARQPGAVRELLAVLRPILQRRVARVLIKQGAPLAIVRQEMVDLVQHVYLSLLENDGHLLRTWDPARGLSFENYCGLIAQQKTAQVLRASGRSPWNEALSDPSTDPNEICSDNPERNAEARQAIEIIFNTIRSELSGLGLQLFQMLFIEERPVEEVCVMMSMTESAVYAWRSRIGRRLEEIAREVLT